MGDLAGKDCPPYITLAPAEPECLNVPPSIFGTVSNQVGTPDEPHLGGSGTVVEFRLFHCDLGNSDYARVFILLSTFNGAKYLRAQLESVQGQTHRNTILCWRDDGSTDTTVAILEEFSTVYRTIEVQAPKAHVGPAASFFALLSAVTPLLGEGDVIAFADQDDVWLPNKLRRGVIALEGADVAVPALYCARLVLVDKLLRRLGETAIKQPSSAFPAALTQNIATGCTIMMNRSAATLVARSWMPKGSLHDWWCYLMVAAAGGHLLVDRATVALYRQHEDNSVGATSSTLYRALGALRRGPGPFVQNSLRSLGRPHSATGVNQRPGACHCN